MTLVHVEAERNIRDVAGRMPKFNFINRKLKWKKKIFLLKALRRLLLPQG